MIAYYPTMETSFRLPVRESAGVSDEAQKLEKLSEEAVDHFLKPKLDLLLPEIESLLATADETPVDSDTIFAATQFAYCLPRFGPLPEVSADPDGEISFDWLGPSGNMFSVSVNKKNCLAYAGWFGENSRIHGIEQLAKSCPQEILRGIERVARRQAVR
jgi:hypothetical protein